MSESLIVAGLTQHTPAELVAMDTGGMTTQLDESGLHELHARLSLLIDDAEIAAERIILLGGVSPSFLPQHLLTMTHMGTGYFRHCRDVMAALFRARNQARKEATK